MTHTSLDSAREVIASFDRQIAELEGETRQHVERLRADGYGYASEQVAKAWDACAEKTRAMRKARESLVSAVATIVGMTAPPTLIVRNSDL